MESGCLFDALTEKVAQREDNCYSTGVSRGNTKHIWMGERTVL